MRTRNQGTTTEARRRQMREYQKANYETILKYQSAYKAQKRKEDPLYEKEVKNRRNIAYYIRKMLPWKENSIVMTLIGMPFQDYITYIEYQFEEGMSWENYGNRIGCWNIDHIIPPSSGRTTEEVDSLFLWKNTRPMWKSENVRKSNF